MNTVHWSICHNIEIFNFCSQNSLMVGCSYECISELLSQVWQLGFLLLLILTRFVIFYLETWLNDRRYWLLHDGWDLDFLCPLILSWYVIFKLDTWLMDRRYCQAEWFIFKVKFDNISHPLPIHLCFFFTLPHLMDPTGKPCTIQMV